MCSNSGARHFSRGVGRPEGFVRGARDAVPLVKPLVVRQPAVGAAEVPFAEMAGSVTGAGQQFGNGHFPLCQAFETAAYGN
jgi:hypothetical protein